MGSKGEEAPPSATGKQGGPVIAAQPQAEAPAQPKAPARSAGSPEVIAELPWGSGPTELGRSRPQEANPEGPMSLAVDARGHILILDQVNARIVRLDSNGKVLGSLPTSQPAPQGLTVARDGTLLVLDRLVDRSIVRLEPDTGKPLAKLPLKGRGVPEPGLITGLLTFDDSIYLQREGEEWVLFPHGPGKADSQRKQLPGRPTGDGRAFLRAEILDRESGRLSLQLIDRETNQPRYTREHSLGFPLRTLKWLDSDRAGTLYLGVVGEFSSQPGLRLYCLEAREGALLGHTELPLNTLPEETFRDFAVRDSGGVIYKHLTPSGVTLLRAHCR